MADSTPISADKRLHLTAGAIVATFLAKHFGINLSEAELLFVGGLVTAYITQSQLGAVKKAAIAGKKSADAVKTPADAAKVLGAGDM